jgi:hypothetical protein
MSSDDSNFWQSYSDEVKDVVLPEWFMEALPEHLPWTVITFQDEQFHVSHDGSVFSTIVEAYDYASAFNKEYQVVLDRSVHGHGGELMDGMFFCDFELEAVSSRLLISHTTEDTVTIFKHDYRNWVSELSFEYNANPDNFVTAHHWLSRHPAFWTKKGEDAFANWETNGGMDEVSVKVWWDEDENAPLVLLETGAHVTPEYTYCRRDDKLSSYAATYEAAVIELARKVNELYDMDGDARIS